MLSIKQYADAQALETDALLKVVHAQNPDPLVCAEQSVIILVKALEEFKSFFLKYRFQSKVEEIVFFREVKPALAAKLIYYNEMYTITSNKPPGSKKTIRKYYQAELKKLKSFFNENAEFYKYCRTGNHSLDNKYFIRCKHDIKLTLDSFYLQADKRFSTSHDYKLAKILGNEQIRQFLESEINLIDKPKVPVDQNAQKLRWTDSKVALIELIYALHAESVLNGGTSHLKQIVGQFESIFDVDLGQFNRTFLEIRGRKSDRTKFLTTLANTLIARMDDADEN